MCLAASTTETDPAKACWLPTHRVDGGRMSRHWSDPHATTTSTNPRPLCYWLPLFPATTYQPWHCPTPVHGWQTFLALHPLTTLPVWNRAPHYCSFEVPRQDPPGLSLRAPSGPVQLGRSGGRTAPYGRRARSRSVDTGLLFSTTLHPRSTRPVPAPSRCIFAPRAAVTGVYCG